MPFVSRPLDQVFEPTGDQAVVIVDTESWDEPTVAIVPNSDYVGPIKSMLNSWRRRQQFESGERASVSASTIEQHVGNDHAKNRTELLKVIAKAEELAAEHERQANVLLAMMENPPEAPGLPRLNIDGGDFTPWWDDHLPSLVVPLGADHQSFLNSVASRLMINAEGYRRYARQARDLIIREWGYLEDVDVPQQ